MKYSIDTSSFIEGFRERLAYPIVPHFWNRDLPGLVESGDLRATVEVLVELEVEDDEVLAFVEDLHGLFLPIDESIQENVREILHAFPRLIHSGRSGADPFVIALAKANGATVVCEEGRGKANAPKIPDVCEAFEIPCIKLYQVVIEQGWEYD
jgi:Domain of unknown function (DUF4411)